MIVFPALSRYVLPLLALSYFSVVPLAAQSDPSQSQSQDSSPAQNTGADPSKQVGQQVPELRTRPEAPSPTMTFRQTVRRVIVDVMVRDAAGKPVHGLTANDFSISEDKEPQRVLSFDVYDFDKPSISRAPDAPPLPPGVFENVPKVPERGPLYVILLDLVNTEMADQMTARQQVLKFIQSKPAGTRFAVFVTTDKLYLVQGFTEDKDLLYAALDPNHPKSHVPKVFLLAGNFGHADSYTEVDMLTHIGEYLDGIPGRKILIWVAGAFPLSISPAEGNSSLADDIKAEINALAQAQIAVFPVDVSGPDPNPPAGMAATSYVSQEQIASATGGRAFYSDNGVADILSKVTEDGGNYYTLTYSPAAYTNDGKCHNIAVKVDKEKYQTSYRRSYCRAPMVATGAEENKSSAQTAAVTVPLQAGDVLQANIKPGAPMLHDLVFSAYLHKEGGVATATPAQPGKTIGVLPHASTKQADEPAASSQDSDLHRRLSRSRPAVQGASGARGTASHARVCGSGIR